MISLKNKTRTVIYAPYVPLIFSPSFYHPDDCYDESYTIVVDEHGHENVRYFEMTEDFLVPHLEEKIGFVPREAPKKGLEQTEDGTKILWRENKPFKASLSFDTIYSNKGGTDIYAILKESSKGYIYYMQKRDFVKLVNTLPCVGGYFVGEWKFKRSGRFISVVSV